MDAVTLARLQLLAAALLFSTGGAGIKLCAFSSWQVAGLRSAAAGVVLLAAMRGSARRWSWRALPVGVAYAATMILFVSGNKLTTAANTIFLQSTAPLYVLLLGPRLLGESVRRRDLPFMAALACGLALFFVGVDPSLASAPDPLRGNAIAALSGTTWALTVLGLRWASRGAGGDASAALVIGNALTVLACLPGALPLAAGTPVDWLIIAYLGVFQVGLAYVCLTAGVRRVQAAEASMLLLLEPVLNPVWAWAVHGEFPGAWALVGGAVIVLSTAAKTWIDAGARRQAVAQLTRRL